MATSAMPVQEVVQGYLDAFANRDLDRALELFSDDAEMVEPPGAFKGKEGVRRLLQWDFQLSPTARSRPLGIGLLVKDNVVIEEEVLEEAYEGIRYEYPLVRIFEIDDSGKIRRLRVYLDRLSMMREIAMQMRGIKGWVFKGLINFVIAQGEKGLKRR